MHKTGLCIKWDNGYYKESSTKRNMTMNNPLFVMVTLFLLLVSFAPLFAEQQSVTYYLTVRRYEGVTDSKEAGRRVQEGFVPLISKMEGFVSYYWVDAGNGVMVSVSVFTSKEAALESNRKAAAWVKANIASLLPNPPQITAGQVVATTGPK
jgi:hypothetical protein